MLVSFLYQNTRGPFNSATFPFVVLGEYHKGPKEGLSVGFYELCSFICSYAIPAMLTTGGMYYATESTLLCSKLCS